VVVEDTPQARGYLHAASHLLAAEPVENEAEVTNRDN
jgi:hypothetical protein